MSVLLSIEESVDANYFVIQRIGGDAVVTPGKILKVTYTNEESVITTVSYTFLAADDLDTGVVLNASTIVNSGTYIDGIYTFTLRDAGDTTTLGQVSEGFAAIVAGQVMRDALNYRPELDIKTRIALLERMRLLNCLSYSATLGTIEGYNENLETLQMLY